MVKKQADGFGMDGQAAVLARIGKSHVRFDGHMGLPSHIKIIFHHHICDVETGTGILPFLDLLDIINIGVPG